MCVLLLLLLTAIALILQQRLSGSEGPYGQLAVVRCPPDLPVRKPTALYCLAGLDLFSL